MTLEFSKLSNHFVSGQFSLKSERKLASSSRRETDEKKQATFREGSRVASVYYMYSRVVELFFYTHHQHLLVHLRVLIYRRVQLGAQLLVFRLKTQTNKNIQKLQLNLCVTPHENPNVTDYPCNKY